MRTISALFDRREDADEAVAALREAGIDDAAISLVGADGSANGDSNAAEGAGVGAAIGGVGGLLAGLGAFAIPGIGPVIGAGWLASTLVGAAAGGVAGGLLGSLTDAGVDERDAHVYAEGVRRGGTLVSARVEEELVDAASAILGSEGSVEISDRRTEYEAAGWTAFDPVGAPWVDEGDARPTAARPIIPPLPR